MMDLYDLGSMDGKDELLLSFIRVRFMAEQMSGNSAWMKERNQWFIKNKFSVLRYLSLYVKNVAIGVPRM